MEKKITDDQPSSSSSSSSSSSAVSGDSRPSLKIRIRISPEMMKQLKWDKEEAALKEINVKSEVKEEEEEVPKVVKEELIEVDHQVKQELLVDCSSFELKLEATKRKFHDSYQQIANAKRQRRIQVIDPLKGTSSKLASAAAAAGTTAKSRILNVILSKKKTNDMNRNNLFSASRSTLLKPSYIC